jgi:tetratricopeptide (TPR) repeat protein
VTGERWERMTELFHAAVALDRAARNAYLDAACAGDPELRAEVDRLISAYERAGSFIERPAVASGGDDRGAGPAPAGRRIGAYAIVREIGRGGMGAVYLAGRVDGEFEQRVAIKLIKRGMDTDLVLRQFRAERQILAKLAHPNIARLLDGGTTDDGGPYFVMEYVEGRPIDEDADARCLTIPERLRLFLQVGEAVAFAHRHRVIHRDLKPVNILVTPEGTPKLLDFGIAKVLGPAGGEPTASITGFRLLTPEYASPEQVQGGSATEVSDVYSLGVVLYELLTGRSPYRPRSRGPLHVIEAVRTGNPQRPSAALEQDRVTATGFASIGRLRRLLRGDLDTIVLTALRKEPARRYQTVALLMEDLRRHLDGRPVRARRDGMLYQAGKFVRGNRAAVLAATGVAMMMLAMGFATARLRAAPSLLAAGPAAPRDRILVADVVDRMGDPALAAAITEAIRIGLTQSPMVRVLSARQVRSTLRQMERSPDLALDDTVAREVAVRDGVKAIVSGRVARVAGRYMITAELLRAETGDLLAAVEETAADSNDVIAAVGRLADGLRERLGESLGSIRKTPPLAQATTSSLEALRWYTEGVRAANAGNRRRALRLLERAVALDTGFASAYRMLGATYGPMVENGRAAAAMEHAIAHQNRLPFYERNQTVATYASSLGDHARAIEAYRKILARYPDEVRTLNNLGWEYGMRREYAAEDSVLVRAVAIDSTIASMQTMLAMARINGGNFEGARQALDQAERRFPGVQLARLGEIYLAAGRQDWETAEQAARRRLAAAPGDSLDRLDGLETLAGIVMTQGRLAEAESYSREVMAMAVPVGSPGRYLSSALRLAYLQLKYRHATAAAVAEVQAALLRFPIDSIAEADRPYDELARFFAAAGRPERAREMIARAERTSLDRRRGMVPNRRWSLGTVALAQHHLLEAEAQLSAAAATHPCPICVLPDLARLYEAKGRPDSALAVYERYVRTPWEWRFETDAFELGRATERLSRLYEEQGDSAKAVAMCVSLHRLWRQADREVRSEIAGVRDCG